MRTARRVLPVLALAAAACAREAPRILSVTIPGDTRDTAGPYVVQIVARGVTGDDAVQIRYTIDDGRTRHDETAEEIADDLWAAEIPGQRQGTTVAYYARIVRDGAEVDTDPALLPGGSCAEPDAGRPPGDGDAGTRPSDAGAPRDGEDAGPPRGDAGPTGCGPAFLYSFRVLSLSGACQADSDCRLGLEICSDGTCRAFTGACGAGDTCPDGYVCRTDRSPPVCAVAAAACADDRDCPLVEECDPNVGECRARAVCSPDAPCPPDQVCHDDLGLCFDN